MPDTKDKQARIRQAVERVHAALDSDESRKTLGEAAERARKAVDRLREARRVDPAVLNRPMAR